MKKILFVMFVLSLFVLVGCQTTTQKTSPVRELPKEIINQEFDMPLLLGKSVSEVKGVLGEPTRETEYEIEYSGDKFELYIEPKGDEVSLLYICGKSGSNQRDMIYEFSDFLVAGNMATNSEKYGLEGSKALIDSSKYTCVTITEK